MEILFFTDNFPPETNAIANRVYERAQYWVRWGHSVTIVTSAPNFPQGKLYVGYDNRWYHVEILDSIRVVRVKTFIRPNKGIFLRTLDFVSYMIPAIVAGMFQKQPSVVAATSPQFFVGISAWIVASLRHIPFVLEIADLWPASIVAVGAMKHNLLIRCFEAMELFLYRRATAIVALTHSFKADMVRRGIPSAQISVIRNGVELSQYFPRRRDAALARHWGIRDRFVVGYIGTHGAAHGLENALRAAEYMQHEKGICLLFVGAGSERETLIQWAESRSLSNVLFVPPQEKFSMPGWWSLCDIALIHLKNDPLFSTVIPSKMFEAMAMGLPLLLVAPQGEASAIVKDEQAGRWIPSGDPVMLANLIMRLSHDRGELQEISRRNRVSAEIHSRERQARDFCILLEWSRASHTTLA